MADSYRPLSVSAENLTFSKAPAFLIGPITEGSQGMLYGPPGVGKTLLAMELGLGLASGVSRLLHQDGASAPQWPAPHPSSVLYVAGEMHNAELAKRMRLGGLRDLSSRFHLLSNAMLWASHRSINIVDRASQELINAEVKATGARLLILDNLDTLTDGIDENSKEQVNAINQWLLTFRYQDIAVLQVHHAAKSGTPRGSSVRSTPLDYQISLTSVAPDDLDGAQGANFNVLFTKVREDIGQVVRPFSMRLEASQWHFSTPVQSRMEQLLAIMEVTEKWDWIALCNEMKVSRSTIFRLRNEAIALGRWQWGRPKKYRPDLKVAEEE